MAVDLQATQLKLDAIRKLYEESQLLKAKLTSIKPELGGVAASDFEDEVKAFDEKFKQAFAMPMTKPDPVVKRPQRPEVSSAEPLPEGEVPRWYQWLGLAPAATQTPAPPSASQRPGWETWLGDSRWSGPPAQEQTGSLMSDVPATKPPEAPKKDLGWSTWLDHKAAEHTGQPEKDDADANEGQGEKAEDGWEKFI